MQIKLDTAKSPEKNAEFYFEKSKKIKKKIEGAKAALERSFDKLDELKHKQEIEEKLEEEKLKKSQIKKEWYEKFRWFFSSDGFLCLGGRDATSNEVLIKKYTDKDDIIFHTDIPGSPFFVVKTEGRKVPEATLSEAAEAAASYSKAWKLGLSTADVFYVSPEQVTKEAKAGEFIAKGAFMVYGKKNYLHPEIRIAIGIKNGKIIGGPVGSVIKNSEKFAIIRQGNHKASDIAKKIKYKLNASDLDEIIRFLPAGECRIE